MRSRTLAFGQTNGRWMSGSRTLPLSTPPTRSCTVQGWCRKVALMWAPLVVRSCRKRGWGSELVHLLVQPAHRDYPGDLTQCSLGRAVGQRPDCSVDRAQRLIDVLRFIAALLLRCPQ